MLDQIIKLVQQIGKDTVVDNPEVPDEHNQEVMQEATGTITSGLKNVMAGGGFNNILDLFKSGSREGKAGLLQNPMVSMMIGHFINKLMGKYNMNRASAGKVANNLIPDVLEGLVSRTTSNAPENDAFDFNDLIGSLTGGKVATAESGSNGFDFQDLLNRFTNKKDSDSSNSGFDLQDIIGNVTNGARQQDGNGSGLMDMIKGLFSR